MMFSIEKVMCWIETLILIKNVAINHPHFETYALGAGNGSPRKDPLTAVCDGT
jgi:hypothetical protein